MTVRLPARTRCRRVQVYDGDASTKLPDLIELTFAVRTMHVRVPRGTRGAWYRGKYAWWSVDVVHAPGAPREVIERAAKGLGLSVAASWLASQVLS